MDKFYGYIGIAMALLSLLLWSVDVKISTFAHACAWGVVSLYAFEVYNLKRKLDEQNLS